MPLGSSYRIAYLTPKTQRAMRRCTICQVAGRVGEWVVFCRSVICPSVYAPDDPDARGRNSDTGGESRIYRYSRMASHMMRDQL